MYVKGVSATTLDDVRAATGTSKSQLYRHFPDKEALVHAVIALRGRQVIERETRRLGRLASFRGLVRWRNALVAGQLPAERRLRVRPRVDGQRAGRPRRGSAR